MVERNRPLHQEPAALLKEGLSRSWRREGGHDEAEGEPRHRLSGVGNGDVGRGRGSLGQMLEGEGLPGRTSQLQLQMGASPGPTAG